MGDRKIDSQDANLAQVGSAYRHKKRGSSYTIIGLAQLQTESMVGDYTALVIYKGEDGQLWARPTGEFLDGRFEPIEKE